MNKSRFTLMVLTTIFLTLTISSAVQAQSRTWVSGVGDDMNPCSRTAPCKTFSGAISKTAANGEIDALDPGGFGSVTVTKNITIDGTQGAGFGGIAAAATSGVTINDSATASPNTIVVVLRNLAINGTGNGLRGVRFVAGKSVSVENCQIFGFKGAPGHGIEMANTAGNAQVVVKDTIIEENSGSAISLSPSNVANTSATLSLHNSRLSRCANGVTMATGVTRATVRNSEIELMSGVGAGNGINMASGTPIIHLHHTSLSHNTTGIAATVGGARLSDVYITNCATSMTTPANVRSWGDNMIFENGTNTLPGGPTLAPKN